jgi:parvulin-like peptidyl-prolyl isomerase
MVLIPELKRCPLAITLILLAISAATSTVVATDSQTPAIPTAVFATDTNAGANAGKIVPGAAAIVDDHIIPMDDLIVACLLKNRSYVIDQMVQGYVLDRECEKHGITVNEVEIDKRVADLRASLAPSTLEETLALHHMTLVELRRAFKQSIEKPLLIAGQIKPVKMAHCRKILVRFHSPENTESASRTNRTEAQALAIIKDLRDQLQHGKIFEDLAGQYSESMPAEGKGDLGVLYENMLGVEAPLLTAAMTLNKGEISEPVKIADGYCLIQALSTSGDHPNTEEILYKEAAKASRDLQVMFLGPKTVVGLVDKSQITFAKDEDIVAGKPLPANAVVIDGHAIPMNEVVEKCLANSGPKTVDILVQNYVVDRECNRLGIIVSEAEIDQRVNKLREQLAPHTMEEALALHHTTMAGLRYDFRQEIERTKLVIDQVKPTRMVHARIIFLKTDPAGESGATRTDADARTLVANIQAQLKAGKSFEELANKYSELGDKTRGGDLGILHEDMKGMDTAILKAALAMKNGEVSLFPVKTQNGYFLLQVTSDSDKHPDNEDAVYTDAAIVCQEEKAQRLIPEAIVTLLKKSKVVYYVHS